MGIKFKEAALPEVSTLDFKIDYWDGVNETKSAQKKTEMAKCKNMSIDNFPYASPRKSRQRLVDEQGIKRIYKIEDGKIYCIDSSDRLCYFKDGVKTILTSENANGEEEEIYVYNCISTSNYDKSSVFYPEMVYTDYDGKYTEISQKVNYTKRFINSEGSTDYFKEKYFWQLEKPKWHALECEAMDCKSDNIPIENREVRTFAVVFVLEDGVDSLVKDEYGWNQPTVRARVFDKAGNIKSFPMPGGYGSTKNETETYQAEYFEAQFEPFKHYNRCVMTIPEEITLEKGDYLVLTVGYYKNGNDFSESETKILNAGNNLRRIFSDAATNYIGLGEAGELNMCNGNVVDYGVIYNNRIVGVRESKICASALGDFSNFWEYVDEAGNPSATGAYATDVGSQGDFTGIYVYQNTLLLFKKNIVYEMYGSMPYTINELCSTGCVDNDSVCEIDGVLYWASPKGVVRYSGGVPRVISTNVNIDTKGPCKAGTDGRKYYLYNGDKIYVYDTRYDVWHIEDSLKVKMFYGDMTDLYILTDEGIYKTGGGDEKVEWEFETGDFTFSTKMRKNLSKLWLRAKMSPNTRLEVYIRQDGGEWKRTAVKTAERDEMFDFKLKIKKCDSFAIKFVGQGDVKILDVHGKVTVGTSRHRAGDSLNIYRR